MIILSLNIPDFIEESEDEIAKKLIRLIKENKVDIPVSSIDVEVDAHNMTPVSIDQIKIAKRI